MKKLLLLCLAVIAFSLGQSVFGAEPDKFEQLAFMAQEEISSFLKHLHKISDDEHDAQVKKVPFRLDGSEASRRLETSIEKIQGYLKQLREAAKTLSKKDRSRIDQTLVQALQNYLIALKLWGSMKNSEAFSLLAPIFEKRITDGHQLILEYPFFSETLPNRSAHD
jgi:DNA repair exonuclease SbcCD ATPase subunit